MMKRLQILFVTLLLCTVGYAQRSAYYTTENAFLTQAIDLYQSGNFAASQRIVKDFIDAGIRSPQDADIAEFYFAANAFELRQKNARRLLSAYQKAHAYSPYLAEVHFMQGVLWAEKSNWKQALKELDQAQVPDLFRQHADASIFYKGYARLNTKEYVAASQLFNRLRAKEESLYYLQSRYFYAYCQYAQGNYVKALPDFLFVEQTDAYKNIAPYYLIQIYYAQKDYDEVEKRAQKMLAANPTDENNCEVYRILGEINYQKGEYSRAIENLSKYQETGVSQNVTLVREDLYLLGMSCYKTEKYDDAITYFKKIKVEKDSISQSTQYHMGNALMKTLTDENKSVILQQAKNCYAYAKDQTFSRSVQEEAMFNYAVITYQTDNALEESVTAFQNFIKTFPRSEHREEVYSLMSDAFMSAKNYSSALNALNQIQNPDIKLLETKQYLLYQLGVDAFIQGKLGQSVTYLNDVLTNAEDNRLSASVANKTYKTEALYLKADAAYRLTKYDMAQEAIKDFRKQANAESSKNYVMAQYLEGYIYFQQKDYSTAEQSFRRFVAVADKQLATYADALNRIGDCYFSQRDFVQAESYYAQVITLGAAGADYATFQRGYALGLLKRYGDKITTLERLVVQYPRSDYADDGLYEIARAEIERDDEMAAIAAYDRLLSTYPNSDMARKAALEKAMLYYNQHNYTEAVDAYKAVIKNYPSTDEAYSALEGLEVCCVETNQVSEYLAYTKTLGKINMQAIANKEDSLTYAAAELQYMQGNYEQAAKGLKTYLNNYCEGGRYCTAAEYFCADAFYQLGKKDAALAEFKRLCEIKANPYMEEALMRAAELTYDLADYEQSLRYFRRLEEQSSQTRTTNVARLGILRCSYYLGDNASTIDVATTLISDPTTDAATIEEARFNRGKAYFAQGLYIKAMEDFRPLAEEVRTAQGAESKYLIAEALFKQGDYADSEQEIINFAGMNTSQQYWLAKAFILLSDIYVQSGNDFQAEQFLIALQQNYQVEDDIQPIIIQRMELIRERANDKSEDSLLPLSDGDGGTTDDDDIEDDEDK